VSLLKTVRILKTLKKIRGFLMAEKCSFCEGSQINIGNYAYKYLVCKICGRHPKASKELAKWVDGVCLKCQKRNQIG